MSFTHRRRFYGPRTRWRDSDRRWHVRGRGELLDRVAELIPGERIDMGNLYRLLRALEEDGLVLSEWDESLPGPAKRTYELTDEGRDLLRAWAKALRETQSVVKGFLERYAEG